MEMKRDYEYFKNQQAIDIFGILFLNLDLRHQIIKVIVLQKCYIECLLHIIST